MFGISWMEIAIASSLAYPILGWRGSLLGVAFWFVARLGISG